MKIKLWFLLSAILYLFNIGETILITGIDKRDGIYLGLYKKRNPHSF